MQTETQGPKRSVAEYLESLAWDGTPRIERWLINYAGAPDTPYVRAVSRSVLVAAVRRIRKPGAEYDEMLILESAQGADSSAGLRALAVEDAWFSDYLPLGSSTCHFMEATTGKWIVELADPDRMDWSGINALKACLLRQWDEVPLDHGRKNTRVARQFVIIGTTNEMEGYLRDATGNCRFWPVRIQRFDLARLRADRDQLWAEAAEAEATGASIRLNPQLYAEAALEQEARLRGDEATNHQHLCVEDPLIDVLYRALGDRTGRLRVSDTYRICGIDPRTANWDQVARLSCAIRELGWERKRRRYNGKFDYAYVKGSDSEREVELVAEYDPHMKSVRIKADRAAAPTAVSRVSARGQPEDLTSTHTEEREGYPARLPVAEEDPIKVTVRSGVEILRGRAGVGEYEPDELDAAVERHVVSVVVGADAFESRHASFDEASGTAMRAARLLGLRGFTYEVL